MINKSTNNVYGYFPWHAVERVKRKMNRVLFTFKCNPSVSVNEWVSVNWTHGSALCLNRSCSNIAILREIHCLEKYVLRGMTKLQRSVYGSMTLHIFCDGHLRRCAVSKINVIQITNVQILICCPHFYKRYLKMFSKRNRSYRLSGYHKLYASNGFSHNTRQVVYCICFTMV